MVHGERDAAAQMAHNQVLLFVFHAVLVAVALGNFALVQGVPDGLVGHFWNARDARHGVQLVHHAGVNGECPARLFAMSLAHLFQLAGETQGNERAQVAGVVNAWMAGVLYHLVVQFIDTALDGFYQSAAPHDDVVAVVERESLQLEFLHD